jgi:hypothetical protein
VSCVETDNSFRKFKVINNIYINLIITHVGWARDDLTKDGLDFS